MRRAPRSHVRGITLIELMVGTMIAAFLTAAAFAFAAHETKLMGVSTERVELSQNGRHSIDLIADDLRQAGAGLGYGEANAQHTEKSITHSCVAGRCFRGLLLGNFTVGGRAFNTSPTLMNQNIGALNVDRLSITPVGARGALGVASGTIPSQAFGIRTANGSYASIVNYSFAPAQISHCVEDPLTGIPTQFQAGEFAVIRHEDHVAARSILLGATIPGCLNARCRFGCSTVAFAADPNNTFQSDTGVEGLSYRGGELHGGLKTIVWFNMPNPNNGTGRLYRAVFDGNTCQQPLADPVNDLPLAVPGPGGPPICGGRVADLVETLNIRVWRWNNQAIPPAWAYVGQGPITTRDKLRVDVELVMRGRVGEAPRAPVQLELVNGECTPVATCVGGDSAVRRAYRTSVEIANGGRMGTGN